MAMLKVNSIIAESHYNVVINKVARNAISPPHTAHGNKQGDVSIKIKKATEKWQKGPERLKHSLKIQKDKIKKETEQI